MEIPKKNEIRKPTKTLAGVTPIAVMCKPKKCEHGTCVYCPSLNVPQSYTPKSPPVLRAKILNYNPYKQIKSRLRAFRLMNHPTEKIELIVMGGDFLEYPLDYQYDFIRECYNALNNKRSKTLKQAKKLNEKTKHRCVALCIETRPDNCNDLEIKRLLEFGCTRVEIGVQCLSNKIYKKVNRGHDLQTVIKATKKLKDSGFKIGYHMMLGLPGSNEKKDLQMFKELFKNQKFKPDQLKIYPCQVIQGARLVEWYKKGFYKPYSKNQTQKLIIKIMKLIPNYCRVMRIMREIPPEFLVAGIIRIDLRRDIESELKNSKSKNKIKEIRFREIGFAIRDKKINEKINTKLKLKITGYNASNGKEYFLEFVNKDNIIFGLCRLRIIKNNKTKQKQAIIRELHVYGKELEINKKSNNIKLNIPELNNQKSIQNLPAQHKALGKMLMKKAEEITKKNKIKELKVISGIGVREYYRKLGYFLDTQEIYMIKEINV